MGGYLSLWPATKSTYPRPIPIKPNRGFRATEPADANRVRPDILHVGHLVETVRVVS
jgi:hypothetical protein